MAITKTVPGSREEINRVERRQVVGGHGYESIRAELAEHTRTTPARGYAARAPLATRVDDAMRQVERSVPNLNKKEVQLIRDIRKGRYIGGVLQALEISRRCWDPTDATALPDTFRGYVIAEHPRFQVCQVEAFRHETDANGEFDLAQYEWMLNPSRVNGERAIEAGRRQLLRTQQAIDAIERAVVGGVRFGRS